MSLSTDDGDGDDGGDGNSGIPKHGDGDDGCHPLPPDLDCCWKERCLPRGAALPRPLDSVPAGPDSVAGS